MTGRSQVEENVLVRSLSGVCFWFLNSFAETTDSESLAIWKIVS